MKSAEHNGVLAIRQSYQHGAANHRAVLRVIDHEYLARVRINLERHKWHRPQIVADLLKHEPNLQILGRRKN